MAARPLPTALTTGHPQLEVNATARGLEPGGSVIDDANEHDQPNRFARVNIRFVKDAR